MGILNRNKKEEKGEEPQKQAPTYVLRNVGKGPSCIYTKKRDEIMQTLSTKEQTPTKGKKEKTVSIVEACPEAFKALGLPKGISYSADYRMLFLNADAKAEIDGDPELQKRLKEVIGIDEKQKLEYKEYL